MRNEAQPISPTGGSGLHANDPSTPAPLYIMKPGMPSRTQLQAYVRRWAELSPILDAMRDDEIRRADTATSIRAFEQAFRIALRDLPPRDNSGLVEWHRLTKLWRERG